MSIHAYSGDTLLNLNKPVTEPQYDSHSKDHYWLLLAGFHVADPNSAENVLDNENLIYVTLECYFCELAYEPAARFGRCPGEPR